MLVVGHIQVAASAADAGDVFSGAGTRESKSAVALSLVEIVGCRTPRARALTASPRTAQITAQ
jgi:hypothetical protein